ncbi:MAG: CBS domain-containing protein, partial [Planctomycetota bacterium]
MSGPPPRENVTEHVARPGPTLRPAQTVAEARDAIRRGSPKAGILYFYVTEDSGRLVGVMPTRTLLVEPDSKVVGDVMLRDVIAIPHTATVLDACEFFILHRLLAFPVVDDEGKLLGTVDVTLYTDELAGLDGEGDAHAGRAVTDDLFQLVGVHLADARPKSPFAAFRGRFPWLLANVAGGLCAAFLTGLFEAELEKAVALALFVPVVLALAESVAIQSVSLALERLHGGRPTLWKLWTRAYEEFGTGLLLGGGAG